MAYALTLLAVLAVFLWATPAHVFIAEQMRNGAQLAEQTVASGSAPFMAGVRTVATSLRERALAVIRDQLHKMVDSEVK